MSATVNDLLFAAMADATRKLADALEEYRTNIGMGRTDMNAESILDPLHIQQVGRGARPKADGILYPDGFNIEGLRNRVVVGPLWSKSEDNMGNYNPIPEPHASIVTATTDRDILETLQGQADELLHAIDLARQNVQGAIPLQTLDLVRGKVKDVLANLTGTIQKDL